MPEDVRSLRRFRDRPRRLMAVFAHPDDESYGCAGTLARAGARGDTATVLVCLTSGEAYSVLRERGLDRAGVAGLRETRMRQVAERVRLDGLLLPRLPDGRLAREPLRRVAAVVGAAIDAFDPQVVVGPDPRGVNAHPDHIAAHWAVRAALEPRPPRRFAMVAYLEETVDAVAPRLLFATAPAEVDAAITLSEAEVEAKEDCLRIHEALVTLREGGDGELLWRPPLELYDLLDEDCDPPLDDLMAGIG